MDDDTATATPGPPEHGDSPLLRWVATLTCVAAGAPVAIRALENREFATDPRTLAWGAVFLLFVGVFWIPEPLCRGVRRQRLLLGVQTVLAITLFYLVPSSIFAVFLVIVAGFAGEVLALPVATVWVVAQSFALLPAWLRIQGLADALIIMGAFLGFQLFAAFASHTAVRERRARAELARTNAELRATRERLAESSRAEERLRIARDLHDVVGHHLTALSLNLEAARHAGDLDAARQPVETAHTLARRLLAEVRRVVSRLRDDDPGGDDLEAALLALAVGIDRPRVHVQVPDDLRRPDDPDRPAPEVRQCLLRCAREMLTNTVRHSGADNLWLELARHDGGLRLTARDDGVGGDGVGGHGGAGGDGGGDVEGHGGGEGYGLTGMRERLEGLGGRLRVSARPGEGYEVTAWLPAAP